MDGDKQRLERYVSRFCSLFDELLQAYEDQPDNDSLHVRLATKATFLACKLKLVPESDSPVTSLLGPEGSLCFDLSAHAHDPRYVNEELAKRAQRAEKIREFQAQAKELVDKGHTLEIAPTIKPANFVKDVNEFCQYIDEIIEIYELPDENAEIHRLGKRANRLAIKIGLMCPDRQLTHMCGIARSKEKIPYVRADWWGIGRAFNGLDEGQVNRWRAWQKRAKALVETAVADLSLMPAIAGLDGAQPEENSRQPHPVFGPSSYAVDPKLVFVLMPFDHKLTKVYKTSVKPVIEGQEFGFTCKRADDIKSNRAIMQDIWSSLCKARLVIADLTGLNPNVFYELGIAHALGKETLLLWQHNPDVKFPLDLAHIRRIDYEDSAHGGKALEENLRATLKEVMGVATEEE